MMWVRCAKRSATRKSQRRGGREETDIPDEFLNILRRESGSLIPKTG